MSGTTASEDERVLRIFISYRRDDSPSYARELFTWLSRHFPNGQVFWDIGAIDPGLDFVEEIERAVGSCDVLVAVIGPHWLDMQDRHGQRRLDDAKDFVRLEIATALARNIRVIPVLVQHAVEPGEEDLPEPLKPLARRNAVELSDSRWEYDLGVLVSALERVQVKALKPPTGRLPGADTEGPPPIKVGAGDPSVPVPTQPVAAAEPSSTANAARAVPLPPVLHDAAHRLRCTSAHTHNLPQQTTALLGRGREVAGAREQLLTDDVRLLTLTGPGGTGKTRLALDVAAEMVPQFEDGVFFVGLAPIVDPELVGSTIAQTLGIRDAGTRPVLDTLKEYLRTRHVLLLLDNFEHVLPAASLVDSMLRAAPNLKVLVTSRAPLEVHGEHEFPVPPLALPDPKRPGSANNLSQYGSVALFVERAGAIRPEFVLSAENAAAVAEICIRLDGLPLAIELAAARIRMLSPQAMLARLERRLQLLTGGARDLPARQQTLSAAIGWSYDLLEERERALFRRLSIFVAGCTLEAAAAVVDAAGLGVDILDGAASLVAKSLVRQEDGADGEPRLTMLETIREFGLERLQASGEDDATRQRYAEYFVALVEEAEPKLLGAEQVRWITWLVTEYDNLRAVLALSRDGLIAGEVGLRVVGALAMFWDFRGLAREAHEWTEAMLALPAAGPPTAARAKALYAAARAARLHSDSSVMGEFATESEQIFRAVGDLLRAGRSAAVVGLSREQAIQYDAAYPWLAESARLAEHAGDQWGLAFALSQLGALAEYQGTRDEARRLRQEGADLARKIGERRTLGVALSGLARLARERGDHTDSVVLFKEALTVSSELEDHWVLPRALAGLAGAAGLAADYTRSARLLGAIEALREVDGTREHVQWRELLEADAQVIRAALGETAFEAAWTEGHAMTLEQVVAYATSDPA